MILTGAAIADARTRGDLLIDPFEQDLLSPNAYDWRLGEELLECSATELDAARPTPTRRRRIPPGGFVLQPWVLYLGCTLERTGSEVYAQRLYGDHTTGSLGVWVHISAPLGHQGHAIRWTLEIRTVHPVRIYAGMVCGKLTFHTVTGTTSSYQRPASKYRNTPGAGTSRLHEELAP